MDVTNTGAPDNGEQRPDFPRPLTHVILAMSADGKISDAARSPARFGSAADRRYLEEQIAASDAVLFGAATLRAYGTTLPVRSPDLLAQRQQQHRSPQPIQIVCSASGDLDSTFPFFQQPVPRWLLTTPAGGDRWRQTSQFDQVLVQPLPFAWRTVLADWANAGIGTLAILGGGELVAALLAVDAIDELHLTVCPLLLGGTTAPSPVDGEGFAAAIAPRLSLLSVRSQAHEVFLRYRVHPTRSPSALI